MLGAGLRFGEAAGLTRDNVGFDSATVTVRNTLSRVRGAPHSGCAQAAVKQACHSGPCVCP